MIMECWCCDMILDRDHGTHAMPAEASRSACYTVIDGACATKSGACRLLGPLFVAFGPDSRALVTILTQVHRFRWIGSYDCVRGINYGTLPSCSNASVLFNLSCFAKYSLSSGRARNDRGCVVARGMVLVPSTVAGRVFSIAWSGQGLPCCPRSTSSDA